MSVDLAARPPLRTLAELPRARGLPLLGNLHQLETRRLHLVLEAWQRELGPMYTFRLGLRPVLVSSDSEIAQQVLRERPQRYRRMASIESVLAEMGGNGVFSVEGEAWLPQRKLVMSALASTHFRAFFPTLQRITERLHRRWLGVARRGQTVEMRDELVRYTVDVTTALVFGEDPNTLEDSGDVIQQHLAQVFPMIMSRINAPLPYWRWLKLPRDRAFERSLAVVHEHIGGLIQRGRERMRANPGAPPAHLLESLLAARDEPGSTMTDDDVRANLLTLLLGGEDTTAISLAWCMPFLAADPALQQRLHERALAALPASVVCADHERLRQLDLFEAVVTETLRFRPTAPAIFLEPTEDVLIAGIQVPRRTPVWLLLRPDAIDERHFSDARSFRPERWLHEGRGQEGTAVHNPRAFLQFGAGPRVCPGRHLAAVEMRLVMSMLMRGFRVELGCDPASIREVTAFTVMPDRMPVRLHLREGPAGDPAGDSIAPSEG